MAEHPDLMTQRFEAFACQPPRLNVLSDVSLMAEAAHLDAFNLRLRLGGVYDIIRHPRTQTPLTIGVYGDWGSGKTSAMRWLSGALAAWNRSGVPLKDEPHIRVRPVWFEPWKYSTREEVWRGLLAEVILASISVQGATIGTVKTAVKRFGSLLGGGFVRVLSSMKVKAGEGIEVEADGAVVKDLIDAFHEANHPEGKYLNEFESTLKWWVGQTLGTNDRLALFIDDLDRCLPDVALQVLEALKLYLNIEKLVFVVGVDRQVVRRLVLTHYETMKIEARKAETYLDKIFQVEATLAPERGEIESFLQSQLDKIDYWKSVPPDHAAAYCEAMLSLAEENPRELKRLLIGALIAARERVHTVEAAPDSVEEASAVRDGFHGFLVDRILDRRYRMEPSLRRMWFVQRFLCEWAEVLKDRKAARHLAVPESVLSSRGSDGDGGMHRARRRDLWVAGDDGGEAISTVVPAPYRRLVARVNWRPQPGLLLRVLADADLGDLLALRPPVWAAGEDDGDRRAIEYRVSRHDASWGTPPEASAESVPGVAQRIPRSKPRPGGRGFRRHAPTDAEIIRSAVARALGASVETLTDQDCTRVRRLDLSGTEIADASTLSGLTALESLDLSGTDVKDATPLSGLTTLRVLNLSGTGVADASLLSGLTALRELNLSGTDVADASPLSGLTAMRELNLSGTGVADVSPLSGLTALQWLNLSETDVADVSPLSGLTALQWLNLSETGVTDVSPLSGLTALWSLSLSGTGVADVSPLSGLTALWSLDLSGTNVADASPLSGLTVLVELNLSGTGVADASPLSGLTALWSLSLSGTDVANASPLSGLTVLRSLDLSGTGVADASPLSGLTALQWLNLSETGVTDVSPLSALTALQWLNLSGTGVADASPLGRLTALENLDLSGTEITESAVQRLLNVLPEVMIRTDTAV